MSAVGGICPKHKNNKNNERDEIKMTFYTWKEETDARELAEKQRNNALSKVSELEAKNKELKEILSDLLLNATAKARYISLLEGDDEETYPMPDEALDSPEMSRARKIVI